VPHVEVNGLSYYIEKDGNGGPAVVMLHGFTGSRSTWLSLIPYLWPDHRPIAIDLIGHGRSASPASVERYAMDRAVDDLVEVVRSLGFERAVWMGYSLGGRTALQVAVRHPDAVSALILEGASPGLETEQERLDRIAADEKLAQLAERDMEAFVDYWQSISLWDSQKENLSEASKTALRQGRLAQRGVGMANSLRGMGTGSQTWVGDRLAEIRVPVLLTAGSLDTKYCGIAREMAAVIPDATLRLIEGAGHCAHLERPAEFNAVVLEFLREVRPRL
jgi:2-succinyl-6-hydroxy-2,4-cyclohexadiene-1-carboxylate synthase